MHQDGAGDGAGAGGGSGAGDGAGGSGDAGADSRNTRLPRHILPRHYRISLEPDLERATFSGTADIAIEILEPTSQIVLNSAELEISGAWLLPATDLTISYDEPAERLSLTSPDDILPGQHTLRCEFTGTINDQLRGFYLSTFQELDPDSSDQAASEPAAGEPAAANPTTHRLGITQFESTNARRAFPCWDEPDFKAVFELQLTVPENLLAVSCMSEVSVSRSPGAPAKTAPPNQTPPPRKTITFAPTPPMSTYLLAFVVGPLQKTQPIPVATSQQTTPLAIVHPPSMGHLCGFATQTAEFSLKFLTDYFDHGYLGDKLDLIAAPDFAFGAMENVGCVTFREILLLLDETTATTREQIRACDVIAHELAHMWFGNLVTMSWWNGIWLKEAFATFMELLVCDAFRPDWKRWELFCLSRAAAMEIDGLNQTRSIEYPVSTPAEAEGMYDLLSYEKGAAAVRMLEQFLTPDVFQEAVRHYIRTHAFGNCDTQDLWAALEEISEVPVGQTMKSWIFEPGFPLVWVEQLDETTWRLTQQRFGYVADGDSGPGGAGTDQLWQIPLVVGYGAGQPAQPNPQTQRLLMTEKTLELPLPPSTKWLLPNSGGDSFIRCGYRGTNPLLTARDQLTASERFVLLDDAWALTLADQCDLAGLMQILSGFAGETSLAVWTRILSICGSLNHFLPDWALGAAQVWYKTLFLPGFERLGGDALVGDGAASNRAPAPSQAAHPTDQITQTDQTEILALLLEGLATLASDPATQAWAKDQHQSQLSSDQSQLSSDQDQLPPDLQAAAINITASFGGARDFDSLLERYANATNPQEKNRCLHALALFPNEAEFRRTLELSLSPQVRTQDAPYLLRGALGHRRLGPTAWHFIKDNWEQMMQAFPSNSIGRMLEGITNLSKIPQDVTAFLADKPVPQAEKMVAQHLEMLQVNASFRTATQDKLGAWFCLLNPREPT